MVQYRFVKIAVFVPVAEAQQVRTAMADAGAGQLGNYDNCTFSIRGIGRFRPLSGSNPFAGKKDTIAEIEEEKIETICKAELVKKVVAAIKKAHPYEEPAIDIFPLLNE